MNKPYLSAAALLLAAGPAPAHAVELEPVIVTATRTARTADATLAPVTVITRETIERRQAQSVQELLRDVPGLSLSNNGGLGKNTSVFLRGTESDHVLVLIDGIKVGSASVGMTAFQDIPIAQIERIEIVRGPRSSLYGSEAIGGVIQIFTRKGGGALKPFFSLGGGSHGTYNANAGISGGGGRGWFNLSAGGLDSEGFNACDGKPFPDGAGCFTNEPDKDGYRNLSGSVRAGYRFGNGAEVDAHVLHSAGDTAFDGGFVNEGETVQQVVGGTLRFAPLAGWRMSLAAGRSLDQSDNFKDGAFMTRFDSERDTVSWQNDFPLDDNHWLTLGLDYQNDKLDSSTDYVLDSRDNTGLFGQYQGTFGAHDVQLSLRQDDNQQFGTHTTGGAAWGYALRRDLRLTASYAAAFKAPSFNELYFPDFGNPHLKPEQSRSFELGLDGKAAWGGWSLNAYATRIKELIGFDNNTYAPANIDQARIHGIEASVLTRIADWDLNANLSLLDARDHSAAANDGKILPRRAKQTFSLAADRQFGPYRVGATWFAAGRRYDDPANTRALAGYGTLDVRAEYALAKAWRVQARIENLFDKDYETAAYYNQPGRGLFVTLQYQP